ncbi:very short patch repair endonuclease [Acidovorax carolinensis]|uniref:Very short patch repair endonuclease n=1 Tax=Acidovorax carolinensis TaxID=553814 RepID=A0A240UHF4_9BURK|nr:very short patch repair endonuclease [Acidovorax carolinensis]ART60535.1 very short patch repair endonuclease [Acidovorax carolinensis]
MADVVSVAVRSAMMAGIKGKNTKLEMLVRKALFAEGYRFRLHRKDLPGSPDIVLPRRKVAIFVHGCFWHAHQGCRLAKLPATRPDFWREKLGRNAARDEAAVSALSLQGWRVLVIWECYLRQQRGLPEIAAAVSNWIAQGMNVGQLVAASAAHPA